MTSYFQSKIQRISMLIDNKIKWRKKKIHSCKKGCKNEFYIFSSIFNFYELKYTNILDITEKSNNIITSKYFLSIICFLVCSFILLCSTKMESFFLSSSRWTLGVSFSIQSNQSSIDFFYPYWKTKKMEWSTSEK